jgi:PAS domain S-box-containing protein
MVMSHAPQHAETPHRHPGNSSLHLIIDACRHQRDFAETCGDMQKTSDALLNATLNAMPTHVAILDDGGRIVLVNRSWRYFVGMTDRLNAGDLAGVDYLSSGILGALSRRHAQMLRHALKATLRGDIERFQHVIHAAHADRWYQISVARFRIGEASRVVVTHEDISAIHAAQDTIKDLSQGLIDLQEKERQRIAIELHDSTAQQLTAIGLYLMLVRKSAASDVETQRAFDEIERLVEETQRELRTFSYLLHPPYLLRDGLKATIIHFVEGYGRRTGLHTSTQIGGEVDGFAPDVQRALLRIIQEALANVHRHASATEVIVRMKKTAKTLLFNVSDNGKGMTGFKEGRMSNVRELGLGLPGMHARISQLGGVLRIASGTQGTTVFGKVPLVRRHTSASRKAFDTCQPFRGELRVIPLRDSG